MASEHDAIEFEWDKHKSIVNLRKHKVSFEEATTVFDDPSARINFDREHSIEENREIIIGYSSNHRLLIVSFTERDVHRVRIISARKATRREHESHEEYQDS